MTLALLLIGAGLVLGVSVFAVATRPCEDAVLAGEMTAVGLADPAAETLSGNSGNGPVWTEWQLTTVSALCDAEDLLDCLEARGYEERELVVLGNSAFAVRWR